MSNPSPRETRGFLNNNPGNMDRMSGDVWQGEIRDPNDERLTPFQRNELVRGRFSVFVAPEWGIRAMVKNLQAYQRMGLRSVRQMIDKWAPPTENNTGAYIAAVAKRLGVGADEPVSLSDYATTHALVDAIIRVECAGMPYSGSELEDGLRLASIVKPVTVKESATMKGAATATAATAAQPAVAALQDPLQDLAHTLEPMADMHQYVTYALLALKIALALVAIYGVWMMVRSRKGRADRDAKIEASATEQGL